MNATVELFGKLYAATDDGLYFISRDGLVENFAAWTRIGMDQNLPENTGFQAMTKFKDALMVAYDNVIYYRPDTVFNLLYEEDADFEIRSLTTSYKYAMASFFCTTGCASKVVSINRRLEFAESDNGCASRIREAISDDRDWTWYADDWDQFRLAPGKWCAVRVFNH